MEPLRATVHTCFDDWIELRHHDVRQDRVHSEAFFLCTVFFLALYLRLQFTCFTCHVDRLDVRPYRIIQNELVEIEVHSML